MPNMTQEMANHIVWCFIGLGYIFMAVVVIRFILEMVTTNVRR